MPFQRHRYPANWREISQAQRERDSYRCAWCGAPHGITVTRAEGGFWSSDGSEWRDRNGQVVSVYAPYGVAEYNPEGFLIPKGRLWRVKVVLTCAHLGPNKHDKMNCRNLASLCQRCHLAEDAEEHAANRRRTLAARKAALQPSLEF